MSKTAFLWLLCNLISIVVLAFYSMLEMACVSFNKVRLQYYVSKGYKRAIWLNELLQNPSRLFGTTLIGVNIALVIGSECAREFHSSLGINPDLAPLSQVILVVIFGELAPMFAARHYAENVAMMGIPLIYASTIFMKPILWLVEFISKLCHLFFDEKANSSNIYLSEEELQKILEDQAEDSSDSDNADFSAVVSKIFSLRDKDVRHVMAPLSTASALPANTTVGQLDAFLKKHKVPLIPLYHRDLFNIVGIAAPRDLLRVPDGRRLRDFARPPWFITETTGILRVLQQFRINQEETAIIIDSQGKAKGIIHLNDLVEEIFGKADVSQEGPPNPSKKLVLINKSFSGEMTVDEFYKQFGILLDPNQQATLSELIKNHLGHLPTQGESIFIDPCELTAKEVSLRDIKTVSITSKAI